MDKKELFHVIHYTIRQVDENYEVMKSNLPTEDKQMHKFTKVASGEREK